MYGIRQTFPGETVMNNQDVALDIVFPDGAEILTVVRTYANGKKYLEHIYYDKPPAELRNRISVCENLPDIMRGN